MGGKSNLKDQVNFKMANMLPTLKQWPWMTSIWQSLCFHLPKDSLKLTKASIQHTVGLWTIFHRLVQGLSERAGRIRYRWFMTPQSPSTPGKLQSSQFAVITLNWYCGYLSLNSKLAAIFTRDMGSPIWTLTCAWGKDNSMVSQDTAGISVCLPCGILLFPHFPFLTSFLSSLLSFIPYGWLSLFQNSGI